MRAATWLLELPCLLCGGEGSSSGLLKLHLSAETFKLCSEQKHPFNTLFDIKDISAVNFQDMNKHMNLIIAFFELSPTGLQTSDSTCLCGLHMCGGDISLGFLQRIFSKLDEEFDGKLSGSATSRGRRNWCSEEFWLNL